MAAVRAAHPEASVEVWATDEHRVGLKPIVAKVWARKGKRPTVRVHHRFKWRYVLAFVHPASGRTEWPFASGINTAVMSVALRYFAAALGAGPTKRIVLVLDQAGYHTSPLGDVPDGIHLVFLPPYSPELQPAEPGDSTATKCSSTRTCQRALVNAHLSTRTCQRALVNAHFATIDDLEDTLADPCDRLQRQQAVIRSTTHFHWWPAI